MLGYLTVCLLGGTIMTHLHLRNQNRRKANGKHEQWLATKSEETKAFLGDRAWSDFKYVL